MPEIGETLREARMRRRIDMTEVETTTKIRGKYLRALENEEWDLLPGPTFVKSFLRTYAEYLGLDARLLVEEYRQRFVELNEVEPPKPILVVVAGVSKDPKMVERMREVYLQRWARSTVEHYEFDNVGFAKIEGYEYYSALANNIAKHGLEQFNGFLADLQVWGSPEQVTEKLLDYVQRFSPDGNHAHRKAEVDAMMTAIRGMADRGVAVLVVAAVGRQSVERVSGLIEVRVAGLGDRRRQVHPLVDEEVPVVEHAMRLVLPRGVRAGARESS